MLESVLVSVMDDEEQRAAMDLLMFYGACGLWALLMGVLFVFHAYQLRRREHRKLFYSSDEVDDIVNEAAPKLIFDYKSAKRVGHADRILSFMAELKMDGQASEKHKRRSALLRRRHDEFVNLRRNLSLEQE